MPGEHISTGRRAAVNIGAVGWALEHSASRGAARLVLVVLAKHASDAGDSFPSISTIAREAAAAPSTVRLALAELERLGEIEEAGVSRYRTRTFRLTFAADPPTIDPPTVGPPSDHRPPDSRTPSTVEAPILTPDPPTTLQKGARSDPNNLQSTTTGESERRARAGEADLDLIDEELTPDTGDTLTDDVAAILRAAPRLTFDPMLAGITNTIAAFPTADHRQAAHVAAANSLDPNYRTIHAAKALRYAILELERAGRPRPGGQTSPRITETERREKQLTDLLRRAGEL